MKFYQYNKLYIHLFILVSTIAFFWHPPAFEALCQTFIVKSFLKFCIENDIFSFMTICYVFVVHILKIVVRFGIFFFVCWIFYNLFPYFFIEHEEHKTERFKHFQRVRKRRWIIGIIIFFLLFPNVLLGKDFIVAPFFDNAHKIIDPFVVKKLYFDNDGYYNDFLYMHILKIYENNPNALKIAAYYDDHLYVGPIVCLTGFQISLIVYQMYDDWIYPFDLFVRRNMRTTKFFRFFVKNFRILRNWLKNFLISYDPFFTIFFEDITALWKKYIKRNFFIFDKEEYEEYYKESLEEYYNTQEALGVYAQTFNKFILEICDFIKDEISRHNNSK